MPGTQTEGLGIGLIGAREMVVEGIHVSNIVPYYMLPAYIVRENLRLGELINRGRKCDTIRMSEVWESNENETEFENIMTEDENGEDDSENGPIIILNAEDTLVVFQVKFGLNV